VVGRTRGSVSRRQNPNATRGRSSRRVRKFFVPLGKDRKEGKKEDRKKERKREETMLKSGENEPQTSTVSSQAPPLEPLDGLDGAAVEPTAIATTSDGTDKNKPTLPKPQESPAPMEADLPETEKKSPARKKMKSIGTIYHYARSALSGRPLLFRFGKSRFVPGQLSKMRWIELLSLLSLIIAFLVYLRRNVFVFLTVAECLEQPQHRHAPHCEDVEYRMRNVANRLGAPAYTLTALLLVPVTRGSLISYLTGLSFEKLIKWHRWISRAMILMGLLHGSIYLSIWVKNGTVAQHSGNEGVIAGYVVGGAMILIWLTSISSVRRAKYHWFWILHVIFGITFSVGLLYHFHVETLIQQAAIPVLLIIFDKLWRTGKMCTSHGKFKVESTRHIGDNIVRVEIAVRNPKVFEIDFAWVLVGLPSISKKQLHPFSLCTLEHKGTIVFYVKAFGPWSNALCDRERNFAGETILIDGPYGGLELPHRPEAYDSLLFVAGGIGITPILPVLVRIVKSEHGAPIELVWSVRDIALVEEFAGVLNNCGKNPFFHASIYITTGAPEVPALETDLGSAVSVQVGTRPDLGEHARSLVYQAESQKLDGPRAAAITCGPERLVTATFQAVAEEERRSGVVVAHLHEETFEF